MSTSSDRGLFVWHEVGTTDLRAGEDFYAKVAGWKAESWSQNPSYKLFVAKRESKAGLYLITESLNTVTPPPSWLSYIGTPDVDATVRQAVELGGKVVVPAYNVPSVGRMAHLQDPQGALFAVSSQEAAVALQGSAARRFFVARAADDELADRVRFLCEAVRLGKDGSDGHGPSGDLSDFRHRRPSARRHVQSGSDCPGGPLWIPYVMVADARRTAETAKELGATIAHGPSEVPGGDWVFTGVDRHGAMFGAQSKKRVVTKDMTITKSTKKITTKKATKDTKKAKPVRSARLQASRKKTAKKRR